MALFAGFLLQICRLRSCRAARELFYTQKCSPTAEREQSIPSGEGPPPSPGFQEHPRTHGAHAVPHPAALWHEVSGLESTGAMETESRLFTGKQFSLVLSHVWLRHTGLPAMPEEVTGEGGRQKYFVFFQPGWSNSVTVTPQISVLALRETGCQERQNNPMEGCKREPLSLAFPQMHHLSQPRLSITDSLSPPCVKQPPEHRAGGDGGFVSLNAFAFFTWKAQNLGIDIIPASCY